MSDEYDFVARGKLKLKTDSNISKNKKKNKKNKKNDQEKLERGVQQMSDEGTRPAIPSAPKMTKAEIAFKKGQEKMVNLIVASIGSLGFNVIFVITFLFYLIERKTYSGKSYVDAQATRREIQ